MMSTAWPTRTDIVLGLQHVASDRHAQTQTAAQAAKKRLPPADREVPRRSCQVDERVPGAGCRSSRLKECARGGGCGPSTPPSLPARAIGFAYSCSGFAYFGMEKFDKETSAKKRRGPKLIRRGRRGRIWQPCASAHRCEGSAAIAAFASRCRLRRRWPRWPNRRPSPFLFGLHAHQRPLPRRGRRTRGLLQGENRGCFARRVGVSACQCLHTTGSERRPRRGLRSSRSCLPCHYLPSIAPFPYCEARRPRAMRQLSSRVKCGSERSSFCKSRSLESNLLTLDNRSVC